MSPQPMSYPSQLEVIKTNMGRPSEEVIALAIAVTGRCDGCIAFHTDAALSAKASREEIMDALGVAVLMGGGPSMIDATHVVEAPEQFAAAGCPGRRP